MFELRHKPQKKQPQIFNFCCISFCRHSTQASERENFLHLILTQNRTLSPRHHRMPNVFVSPPPIPYSTIFMRDFCCDFYYFPHVLFKAYRRVWYNRSNSLCKLKQGTKY